MAVPLEAAGVVAVSEHASDNIAAIWECRVMAGVLRASIVPSERR
jgi:hypothetical protein